MRYLTVVVAVLLALALAAAVHAQEQASYQGAWRGPFLFHVVQQGTGAQGPPAVHSGTMRIDADGTVHGRVPEAACILAGSSIDYVSPANASLDLTLSGCKDARFNSRFSGKLINNPLFGYASMRLSSTPSLDAATAKVSAIVRR